MLIILNSGSLNFLEPSGLYRSRFTLLLYNWNRSIPRRCILRHIGSWIWSKFSGFLLWHTYPLKLQGFFHYCTGVKFNDVFLNIRNNELWTKNWDCVEGNGLTWFKMSSWVFLADWGKPRAASRWGSSGHNQIVHFLDISLGITACINLTGVFC